MTETTERALIVVDVQRDFCPGGKLAVTRGDGVVRPLNHMIDFAVQHGWEIFFSRDCHPAETKHFKKWPVHCVENTEGAKFHPNLHLPRDYEKFRVISKGSGNTDGYSAFDGGMLPRAKELYVGGLATDYCVLETVKSAVKLGYKVTLLFDACRAVNREPLDGRNAIREMVALGVAMKTATEVLYGLRE